MTPPMCILKRSWDIHGRDNLVSVRANPHLRSQGLGPRRSSLRFSVRSFEPVRHAGYGDVLNLVVRGRDGVTGVASRPEEETTEGRLGLAVRHRQRGA
jgi:hypothetical protein